ncbi:BQ5605_C001g00680 [Microbotryum silenes-dioicae]|uniref:BQ5605_C001g00680 protein n=1 Tax=Microbotryum silenes-dioicae TaxID=796604 RepID=A0A2X0M416_9BASI|nr:BQ5605_C001g00680 [Microbotryum silenes-dioicae]
MLRPTSPVLSKASRLPMMSKQGNKNYYKGTGSMPGLGPKAQGRHGGRGKAPYILMAERMRTFVVPLGLNTTDLKPYVAKEVKLDTKDGLWPMAATKGEDQCSKRGGLYGPKGFDGEYYLQLAEFLQKQDPKP